MEPGGNTRLRDDGDDRWPTRTPSITTTTWSIPARGRWSASIAAFDHGDRRDHLDALDGRRGQACSACTGPWVFAAGFAAVMCRSLLWWRDVINEAHQGDHTPVVQLHLRYGMILFIASEVMFFVAWFWAYFEHRCLPGDVHTLQNTKEVDRHGAANNLFGGEWPPVPVEALTAGRLQGTSRHVRSLGPAAGQHADPAALGHDGDLGASCAAQERSHGAHARPDLHRCPRRARSRRSRPIEYSARRLQLSAGHVYGSIVLHGDGLPRLRTS